MTANEIRKWDKAFEGKDVTAEVARARARIEIAAQLAELNELFKSVIGREELRGFPKKFIRTGTE